MKRNKIFGLMCLLVPMIFPDIMSGKITEPTDSVTDNVKADSIQHSAKMLDEIVVSRKLVSHVGNTDSYIVTKKMLKDVHDTGELLGKIDGVFYNPVSTDLSYLGSNNVIILIDSVERDQAYLKRLNPNRLSRISVTNQPSGRYSQYDAVINLTTKQTYEGYDGVVLSEINLRPSHTEGSDILSGLRDVVETTYTRDKWNIAFSGSYKRINESGGIWFVKDYIRNDFVEETERPALNKPNRKVVNDQGKINLWIDYRITKRHSLSLGLNLSPGYGSVVEDLIMKLGKGSYRSTDRQRNLLSFSPSLNYRGRFRNWYASAYFQYSTNTFDRLWSVERKDFGLNNDRHVFADYLWTGFDVSRNFAKKLYLSIGERATYTRYEEKDLHECDLLSHGSTFRNKLTASMQYTVTQQFSFGVNAGIDIYRSKYGEDSLDEVAPLLGANLTYSGSRVLLRLNYSGSVRYPSLFQMQDYGRFTDSLVYRQGNPDLRNILSHKVNASLTLFQALTLGGEYTFTNRAVFEIADMGSGQRPDGIIGDYVDYNYRNGDASQWKVNLTFRKSWRSTWTFAATATLKGEKASYGEQTQKKTLPVYDWYVMYNCKKADMQVYLSSALHSDLMVTPQQLGWERSDRYSLSVMKFLGKGKIQMMLMWNLPIHFITKPYKSEFRSPALVETRWSDYYRRNDNALTFTFLWRFSGGNKTRNYSRNTESVSFY